MTISTPPLRRLLVLPLTLALLPLLLVRPVLAAGGHLDPNFNPGADSTVLALALQGDGKVVIGGGFTAVNGIPRNRIARLNADGSLDASFALSSGADGAVRALAVQADGKVVIGGEFTTVNGTPRTRIARLNANGSLDASFDPGSGADRTVVELAVQSDGKVVIGGDFTAVNGTSRTRIARLNANGSLDTSFAPDSGANSTVYALAVQADGKVVISGRFTTVNGTSRRHIARLNANGSLDASFDPGSGASGVVDALAVQADGKVVIGGEFTTVNGTPRTRIARLNANGSLDASFALSSSANGAVRALAVQADGKVVIGGEFTTVNGTSRNRIARLNANGSLDTSFAPDSGANSTVWALVVQADGKVVIGGNFTTVNGQPRTRIARLLPASGALAFSAATASVGEGDGAATLTLSRSGGTDNSVTARVDISGGMASAADYRLASGSLDASFALSSSANGAVRALAVQGDGKVVIGGGFTSVNGTSRNYIARLNADGSLDASFAPSSGAGSVVYALAVQGDGKVVIGGSFTSVNGQPRNHIARLNTDGSLDASFAPSSGANGAVDALAVQGDGKVVIGGGFRLVNGTSRRDIARLNANGSLDTSFAPGSGASDPVRALAVQGDGKVVIGGYFKAVNETPRTYIARLNADGSLDTSFAPSSGANDTVQTLAVQGDGKVVIGGDFTAVNETPRNHIARLNADGSLDASFAPSSGASDPVYALAVQGDGKVVIGGEFTAVNGQPRDAIARLAGDLFVTWAAGSAANQTLTLPIVDDTLVEGDETLTLTLIPLGGATLSAPADLTLTIRDNDYTLFLPIILR
jgi:uncharacterized delta-60 repeat protein